MDDLGLQLGSVQLNDEGVGVTCFRCGEQGHLAQQCSQAVALCFNCKKAGHVSKDCPDPHPPVVCYRCNEEGHMSRECPQIRVPTCYKCSQEGHVAKDCPAAQVNGGGQGTANMTCYACGKTGHVQRSCPNNPNGTNSMNGNGGPPGMTANRSRVVCNRCLQLGHTSRNCMAPVPRHQGPGRADGPPRGGFVAVPGRGGFSNGAPTPRPVGPPQNGFTSGRPSPNGPPPSGLANANVRCFVCQGYGHLQRSCPSKATLGVQNGGGQAGPTGGQGGEVTCYYCGQSGHVQKNCPAAQNDSKCFQCGLTGHVSANCTKLECFQCGGPHFARACPEKESRM